MARYQFKQDNWSYGMSADELGGGGTVAYAAGVNIFDDKSKFTLLTGINTVRTQSSGTDTLVAANIIDNSYQIWIGDEHTIYDYLLATSKTLTNTSANDKMCNCGVVYSDTGVAHGFIIQRGYVSKYTWNAAATDTGVSTLTERHVTFTPTGNDQYKRPFYIEGNYVYFGAGSDVKVFSDIAGTFTLDTIVLEIDRGQTITAITKIGDLFYVYATDGKNGYQYLWDGASSEAERIIRWADLPIDNAANFGNYDYVVCKDSLGKAYLFKVSGYSRQLLRQSGYFDDAATARFALDASYTNAIESIGELLLIGSNASENGVNGPYCWGRKHAQYPEAMSRPLLGLTGSITCLYGSGGGGFYVYAATKSGNTKRVYNWFKPFANILYETNTGFVETNPIVGQFGEAVRKTAVKYRLGYRLPSDETCHVKIYYRKDAETSYTLHKTITGTVPAQYASVTFPLGVQFNRIQFKIELSSTGATYPPQGFDFTLEYEPVQNNLGL